MPCRAFAEEYHKDASCERRAWLCGESLQEIAVVRMILFARPSGPAPFLIIILPSVRSRLLIAPVPPPGRDADSLGERLFTRIPSHFLMYARKVLLPVSPPSKSKPWNSVCICANPSNQLALLNEFHCEGAPVRRAYLLQHSAHLSHVEAKSPFELCAANGSPVKLPCDVIGRDEALAVRCPRQ